MWAGVSMEWGVPCSVGLNWLFGWSGGDCSLWGPALPVPAGNSERSQNSKCKRGLPIF